MADDYKPLAAYDAGLRTKAESKYVDLLNAKMNPRAA